MGEWGKWSKRVMGENAGIREFLCRAGRVLLMRGIGVQIDCSTPYSDSETQSAFLVGFDHLVCCSYVCQRNMVAIQCKPDR